MSRPGGLSELLSLLAYEKLGDHGFALPIYRTSTSANALHIAVPSLPGDPAAVIVGFEVYNAEAPIPLDADQERKGVGPGAAWLDVFLWGDAVYVGTKSEIWQSISDVREELERSAPLTLLALADGAEDPSQSTIATAAYRWLVQDWGSSFATRWQVDTYLRNLALRDLRRWGDAVSVHMGLNTALADVELVLRHSTLELTLPWPITQRGSVTPRDLPSLIAASEAFGLDVDIAQQSLAAPTNPHELSQSRNSLLMRIKKGRGNTQTQIPFKVIDQFFASDLVVRSLRSGRVRSMTMSKAEDRRNTMKLQLPEMVDMIDPVVRFERDSHGTTYDIHDSSTPQGQVIASLLEEGLRDGSTRRTRGGATWWRFI